MSDLSTMKSRIAGELARSDLTSQIADAITTTIEAYQTERFYFNESRDVTFDTVANQEFYDSSDNTNIPDLLNIDWATIAIGSTIRTLEPRSPEKVDYDAGNTSSTGQPYSYAYYQQKLRLYPKPNAVHTVRINAHIKLAAPASDSETDNAWMMDAERLIRSHAKYELATHVLRSASLAAAMSPYPPRPGAQGGHEAWRAFTQLKGRTNRQVSTGEIRPYD